jgi:hypothetical protein
MHWTSSAHHNTLKALLFLSERPVQECFLFIAYFASGMICRVTKATVNKTARYAHNTFELSVFENGGKVSVILGA